MENKIDQRPYWVPDSDVTECSSPSCKMTFDLLVHRRHHCRHCGKIFCDNCSKNKAELPEFFRYTSPKRVCDACFIQLSDSPDKNPRFHQAGGHSSGVIRTHPGFVTKHTNSSELKFFQGLAQSNIPLEYQQSFFPKVESTVDHLLTKTVTMEDLTFGYQKPCVMDVKMGNTTVGDDANIFKELYMVNKDKTTTSFELGCRIVAYRTYDTVLKDYKQLGKGDANKVSNFDQFKYAFLEFFNSGNGLRIDVLTALKSKLVDIHQWMSTQTSYKFIASSLLFVYDAELPLLCNVKMIDFAHVFEITNSTPDLNYIQGLDTIISIVNQKLEEASAEKKSEVSSI